MTEKRKLCRSMSDKAIFGVCSGFARYFDIDPIIIRLAVVLLAMMGTLGFWFYIIAAVIMPKDTDINYQPPRYDGQTGRPLYEAGGTVYENRAGGMTGQADPVQDAEFTTTAYSYAETVRPAENADTAADASASAENADAAADVSAAAENTASDAAGEGFANTEPASAGDKAGSWSEPPRQDPYGNFQAYNSGTQQGGSHQSHNTDQTYQSHPETAKRSSRSSRNTGLLFIIVGLVILAKILLPKVNVWIPISVAMIFFGIYLCCRKK